MLASHTMRSWMWTELSLDHMEAAQGSFSTQNEQSLYPFKRHAVNESLPHGGKLTTASFWMPLVVYYSS